MRVPENSRMANIALGGFAAYSLNFYRGCIVILDDESWDWGALGRRCSKEREVGGN